MHVEMEKSFKSLLTKQKSQNKKKANKLRFWELNAKI